MLLSKFRTKFYEKYRGDLRDPVFDIILDTFDSYNSEVLEHYLLSIFQSSNNEIPDAFFEVFKKNLFGAFYPGPVYCITQASLRNVKESSALKLYNDTIFNLQDSIGNKNILCPVYENWIVPAYKNEVEVRSSGSNLLLGFDLTIDNINFDDNPFVSIYFHDIDSFTIERMRAVFSQNCILADYPNEPINFAYPSNLHFSKHFYSNPYKSKFILIELESFIRKLQKYDDLYWYDLNGLGELSSLLVNRLKINSFTLWNFINRENTISIKQNDYYFELKDLSLNSMETIISRVWDIGFSPFREHFDSSIISDPNYPYQFTSSIDKDRDLIKLILKPNPEGDIKVQYYQYDLNDLIMNIPSGKPLTLFKGMDENLKSVFTITETKRNLAINSKKNVWDYFTNQVSSRNRLLSKQDLKYGIQSCPFIESQSNQILFDNIVIEEKIGRVKGFITTYSEISVPIKSFQKLSKYEINFLERSVGNYLKDKTVQGHYLRVKFIPVKND